GGGAVAERVARGDTAWRARAAEDALVEDRQRQRALGEHGVVEAAQRERGAVARLDLAAHPQQLELADLVGEGLAGPRQVALDLADDERAAEQRVLLHEGDGLGAR